MTEVNICACSRRLYQVLCCKQAKKNERGCIDDVSSLAAAELCLLAHQL